MTELPHRRYLVDAGLADLREKLVFIGGPRQVGKTTLALLLLGAHRASEHPGYINWDIAAHRQRILAGEISAVTVRRWLTIFDNLYLTFRVSPYGAPRIRAVKKEQKLYFWDWSAIDDPGARFENLVACQLLKFCHFREDTEGFRMELRYIRDTDRREVDFVVLEEGKPLFAVECEVGERSASPHLRYFSERTPIPHFYQVHTGEQDYAIGQTLRVLPFVTFARELRLP